MIKNITVKPDVALQLAIDRALALDETQSDLKPKGEGWFTRQDLEAKLQKKETYLRALVNRMVGSGAWESFQGRSSGYKKWYYRATK